VPSLLISARQVLTGPEHEVIDDGAVVVTDGRITAVGGRDRLLRDASEVTELTFPDCTLLPGLINAHVHLGFDASDEPTVRLQTHGDLAALALMMADHARQLLDVGVTTARDLGDRDGLAARVRDAIARGSIPGPRLLVAGAPITPPGGHCWYLGGVADGEAQIRQRVRENAAAGVDLIKVMASGGQTTPGGAGMSESQYSTRELVALVEEAHGLGLPVAAHAHGVASIDSAIAAGVDTIEHCTFLAGPGRFEPSEELAAQIVAKAIAVCPGSSGNWRALARKIGKDRAYVMVGRTKWLADRGVRVIPGTDAGLSAFNDFPMALRRYLDFGFRPGQVIAAATVEAAAAMGVGGVTGRLAEGLDADLLVVDGDPRIDLTALAGPVLVMARGRTHLPPESVMWGAGQSRVARN
jgi:imidazolonepropionase-like amidohydrolase